MGSREAKFLDSRVATGVARSCVAVANIGLELLGSSVAELLCEKARR